MTVENTQTEREQETVQDTEGSLDDVKSEIASRIDIMVSEKEKEHNNPEEYIPSTKDQGDDVIDEEEGSTPDLVENGKNDEAEGEANTISDELFERAVRSGLSISDVKAFSNAEVLERMCDRLENVEAKNDDQEVSDEEDDPFDSIPDINEEEYDEDIVNVVKALKNIAKAQSKRLKELEASNSANSKKSILDTQISNLDKKVISNLKKNPDKESALRKQYSVLEAGYKATGETVSPEEIFNQAVNATISDVVAETKKSVKEDKLRNRESQFVSRPGRASSLPVLDPKVEAADLIDRQFFNKK